ncbi:MAG: hypothetical protein K2Q10_09655, partial [Rhodospirillales bacterium]|nr:hypothetical protein [Rhodospirillales bacterium]
MGLFGRVTVIGPYVSRPYTPVASQGTSGGGGEYALSVTTSGGGGGSAATSSTGAMAPTDNLPDSNTADSGGQLDIALDAPSSSTPPPISPLNGETAFAVSEAAQSQTTASGAGSGNVQQTFELSIHTAEQTGQEAPQAPQAETQRQAETGEDAATSPAAQLQAAASNAAPANQTAPETESADAAQGPLFSDDLLLRETPSASVPPETTIATTSPKAGETAASAQIASDEAEDAGATVEEDDEALFQRLV